MLDFRNVIKYWKNEKWQNDAMDMFQATMTPVQVEDIYRVWTANQGTTLRDFKIRNIPKYYQGKQCQALALSLMNDMFLALPDSKAAEIEKVWRSDKSAGLCYLLYTPDRLQGFISGQTQPTLGMVACSGAPGHQVYRPANEDWSGSKRPCPEGVYRVNGPFYGNWGEGIGKVCFTLEPVVRVNNRTHLLIHADDNRRYAPGSLGCVCPLTGKDMKLVTDWTIANKCKYLVVHYGFRQIESLIKEMNDDAN